MLFEQKAREHRSLELRDIHSRSSSQLIGGRHLPARDRRLTAALCVAALVIASSTLPRDIDSRR